MRSHGSCRVDGKAQQSRRVVGRQRESGTLMNLFCNVLRFLAVRQHWVSSWVPCSRKGVPRTALLRGLSCRCRGDHDSEEVEDGGARRAVAAEGAIRGRGIPERNRAVVVAVGAERDAHVPWGWFPLES